MLMLYYRPPSQRRAIASRGGRRRWEEEENENENEQEDEEEEEGRGARRGFAAMYVLLRR